MNIHTCGRRWQPRDRRRCLYRQRWARRMSALGPTSCALGPHPTGTLDARHLCNAKSFTASFTSATIYYPTASDVSQLPSIVIVGGHCCGEKAMAAWGPFYASHGIVAMTIGTPAPWRDFPAARCKALLDASLALQSENERAGSELHGRLDVTSSLSRVAETLVAILVVVVRR